jgi:tRNA-splicing ligase RtcB
MSDDLELAPAAMWLEAPLESDVAAAIERLRRAEDVWRVAVMPDVHLAKDVCVGTVLATRRLLYPGAVGGDIGCGMLAVPFDAGADVLADPVRAADVLKALATTIPPTRRHRTATHPYPIELVPGDLSHGALAAVARTEGAMQLGTLGGGNHFVELQADEDQRLWLMIHSGSRAMGQAIRGHHVARGTKSGGYVVLDSGTDAGRAYVGDVEWARRYADANRRAMAGRVIEHMARLFGIRATEAQAIACDHNHVARESHFGEDAWVHRKGAMPAADGAAGVVPGSMGTWSYHVIGRGCEQSLRSSAHGAGRRMSREGARKQFSSRELCRQMKGVWFDPRAADRLRDEAPRAYKDVRGVIRASHALVRVTRMLRPVLTYKGA